MCSFFDFGLENLNAVSKVCGRNLKLVSPACHPDHCQSYNSSQSFVLNVCGGNRLYFLSWLCLMRVDNVPLSELFNKIVKLYWKMRITFSKPVAFK